jgi:preprotein translocase subunit SecD
MIASVAILLLTSPENIVSTPWDNVAPEAQEKPCELIPYFGANGKLAIGGVIFEKSDIDKIETIFEQFENYPALKITISETGLPKFKEAQLVGIGKLMPLCFNNQTLSNPVLVEFIEGNEVQITGGFDEVEAEELRDKILNGLAPVDSPQN